MIRSAIIGSGRTRERNYAVNRSQQPHVSDDCANPLRRGWKTGPTSSLGNGVACCPRLNRHAAAAVAGWRSTPLGTYSAVSCSVCFVFDGGDKVRGKKVHKCS